MNSISDPSANSMSQEFAYSGKDNLEVMAEARRYTAFLMHLIEQAGGDAARRCVADFGAGTGLFADLWISRTERLICIEPDPQLRHELMARGLLTAADAAAIADASQDFVYTLNVLEHIPDDRAAVAEFHRMLKPGGRLLVYVPAFRCLYSAMDHKVGHLRRYRRGELADLLRAAGFEIEKAAYADSLGFFASLAYRFTGRADGRINMRALLLYDRFVLPISLCLDRLLGNAFGKNTYVVAVKPAA